ncbi:MAG: hypothetical protein KF811_15960 [Dokdonella sp.]|nr:hypothetical protein [Dokdonella sp.]MCB1570059.1 hypothetical protein [Xanthomonadales bacterium]MCB1575131.1 hypothetical protein [Xanthomonadales bacterium]MCB1577914.1 hypothetical protein [Xanthomonadales bacterium]
MFMRRACQPVFRLIPALLVLLAASGTAFADPPGRVARLSHVGGDVSMRPAGLDDWTDARINRPLIAGDNLHTDRASRVEMEIGGATIRLDERTSFGMLDLDDDIAQVELTEGTLSLTVRRIFEGQSYEVDTPTLALVIDQVGQYRIDIAPDGSSTMVTVIDGGADVYGSNNSSFRVRDGFAYRFYDTRLEDYETLDLPRQDDFDRWCYERAERYERSPSRRYVSDEVIGYADLDDYGSWSTNRDYGAVWYPTRVEVDWAPYRDGHWAWIDPWGWTWVDNAPWGFAPSHYGRWAFVGNRWGWLPCPRNVRPVYAPALVAFVGGGGFSVTISSGGPVGWFPLGPRDVYVPWYRGSRDYFNRVNIRNTTIINNTYITNVYNDYSRGRPIDNFNYAYRRNDRAFTAVSHDAFINARAVQRSRVQVNQAQLARSQVVSRVQMTPTPRSFVGGSVERGGGRAVRAESFDRQVIARREPALRRMDAQSRIQAITRNDNQPLAASEMRELSARRPQADAQRDRRIKVVGEGDRATAAAPRALPQRNATERGRVERAAGAGRGDRSDAEVRAKPAARGTEATTPVRPATGRSKPLREESPADRERRDSTIRAPRPVERTKPQDREVQQRPLERATPQERESRQGPLERREQPVRPVPQSTPQREVAPQREIRQRQEAPQRELQQREIRERPPVQYREAPQRAQPQMAPREMPQREIRERPPQPSPAIQQRSAPQPVAPREIQQRQQRSAPVEPQRAGRPAPKDDQDKDNKDERKRRDRN